MMNKLSILFSFVINALLFVSVAVAQDAPNKTDAKGEKQGYWIKYDENKIKSKRIGLARNRVFYIL